MYTSEDKSRWLVRVEEKLDGGLALIHYKGWRHHFDEAVPCSSLRPKPSDDICKIKNAQFLDSDRFLHRSTKPLYPCTVAAHSKSFLESRRCAEVVDSPNQASAAARLARPPRPGVDGSDDGRTDGACGRWLSPLLSSNGD